MSAQSPACRSPTFTAALPRQCAVSRLPEPRLSFRAQMLRFGFRDHDAGARRPSSSPHARVRASESAALAGRQRRRTPRLRLQRCPEYRATLAAGADPASPFGAGRPRTQASLPLFTSKVGARPTLIGRTERGASCMASARVPAGRRCRALWPWLGNDTHGRYRRPQACRPHHAFEPPHSRPRPARAWRAAGPTVTSSARRCARAARSARVRTSRSRAHRSRRDSCRRRANVEAVVRASHRGVPSSISRSS